MCKSNNAPFSVGQEVVCVKAMQVVELGIKLEYGKHYTIQQLFQCKCGEWWVDVGFALPDGFISASTKCTLCWHSFATDCLPIGVKYFAPLQAKSITISKTLKKETEEWMQERVKETSDAPVKVKEEESVPV